MISHFFQVQFYFTPLINFPAILPKIEIILSLWLVVTDLETRYPDFIGAKKYLLTVKM